MMENAAGKTEVLAPETTSNRLAATIIVTTIATVLVAAVATTIAQTTVIATTETTMTETSAEATTGTGIMTMRRKLPTNPAPRKKLAQQVEVIGDIEALLMGLALFSSCKYCK